MSVLICHVLMCVCHVYMLCLNTKNTTYDVVNIRFFTASVYILSGMMPVLICHVLMCVCHVYMLCSNTKNTTYDVVNIRFFTASKQIKVLVFYYTDTHSSLMRLSVHVPKVYTSYH
jgi:hypothetical protein